MKIAFILLCCLVAVSYQQRFYPQYFPRFGYSPYFYGQPLVYNYENANDQEVDNEPDYNPTFRSKFSKQQPQNRLFFADPLGLLNLFAPTASTTTTVTSWTTTTVSKNETSIQYCIISTLFSTNADKKVSTTACARRRREVALVADVLESIRPSELEQFEASAVPQPERQVHDEPLLLSSKDEVEHYATSQRRSGRAASVVVTSTYTSYKFSTVAFQKPIAVVADAVLQCLPPGLVLCN